MEMLPRMYRTMNNLPVAISRKDSQYESNRNRLLMVSTKVVIVSSLSLTARISLSEMATWQV